MVTHAKARRDFELLENIAELTDQVSLDDEREWLMQDPTKARAADMYCSGISLWFSAHGDSYDSEPEVRRIRRYYEAEGHI